jgi:tetrahydromethanopterin S-methyltransferase subunit G
MHNEDDMKRKGDVPATKNDLQALESAIRKDLQACATKNDLQACATKNDLQAQSARLERVERVVKNIAVEVSRFGPSMKEMREEFSSLFVRMESRQLDRMDAFMAKTVKVEREQFWLVHRMDKIEDRVSRIEKRAP